MGKKNQPQPETPGVRPEAPKSKKSSFDVYDKNGEFVRTYTKEQGEDFEKKAKGFAEKIGGSIK